ncbi:hypothetical protein SPRG_04211 [Saprolegnia parasitica CBS 223.65]|uniref:Uncharacterized protein n=1 Tax=Saprolegnia parasitica (strain CBS 223.65) TaxID=695850 RepID=A0A067CP52_SAPPC|nr:hypothetical protein SPRG_04211 [Saprolegnia parasitica CBS 223.65]KDO31025.1 hypothetical protein SPRG_04211 [Saprolegnia parasitica CBS 223.65]|eukprot:XP_012198202.1 hypothetical protein SPRG_04211 [Saprolegnia parasitica CBS 223.65]
MAEAPTPKLMALSDLKAAHRRSLHAIASIAEEEIGAMAKTAAGTTAPVKNQSAKASLLQANVNEMCAATYTHLFRHYFPTSDAGKEAKAAIDPTLLARMRELEEQIKATEESIQGYRTQLPIKIRDIVQTDFDAKAKLTGVKRKLPDVAATLVAPTLPDLSDVQASFTQTAAKIHELKNTCPSPSKRPAIRSA